MLKMIRCCASGYLRLTIGHEKASVTPLTIWESFENPYRVVSVLSDREAITLAKRRDH